jgi:hypothetical protein
MPIISKIYLIKSAFSDCALYAAGTARIRLRRGFRSLGARCGLDLPADCSRRVSSCLTCIEWIPGSARDGIRHADFRWVVAVDWTIRTHGESWCPGFESRSRNVSIALQPAPLTFSSRPSLQISPPAWWATNVTDELRPPGAMIRRRCCRPCARTRGDRRKPGPRIATSTARSRACGSAVGMSRTLGVGWGATTPAC